MLTAFLIPARSVHRHHARGIARDDNDDNAPVQTDSASILVRNRPLLLLAIALAAFNLGNSAMLPLYSLAVASTHKAGASQITAANIGIAQVVMLLAAAFASRLTRRFGFWWIILVTLLTLPLRAVTAAWLEPPWGIFPVQILDGIGAGLQSVRAGARRASSAWQRSRESGAGRGAGRSGGGRVSESAYWRMARAPVRLSGCVHAAWQRVGGIVRDMDWLRRPDPAGMRRTWRRVVEARGCGFVTALSLIPRSSKHRENRAVVFARFICFRVRVIAARRCNRQRSHMLTVAIEAPAMRCARDQPACHASCRQFIASMRASIVPDMDAAFAIAPHDESSISIRNGARRFARHVLRRAHVSPSGHFLQFQRLHTPTTLCVCTGNAPYASS